MMIPRLKIPTLAIAFAFAMPAAAQEREAGASSPDSQAVISLGTAAEEEPFYPGEGMFYSGDGYSAEEYYWMNPDEARWPHDLDPREGQYLPSPEPRLTIELDAD